MEEWQSKDNSPASASDNKKKTINITVELEQPTSSIISRYQNPSIFRNGVWWLVVLGLGGSALAFGVLIIYDVYLMEKRQQVRGPAYMNAFRVTGPLHGENSWLARNFLWILCCAVVIVLIGTVTSFVIVLIRKYED